MLDSVRLIVPLAVASLRGINHIVEFGAAVTTLGVVDYTVAIGAAAGPFRSAVVLIPLAFGTVAHGRFGVVECFFRQAFMCLCSDLTGGGILVVARCRI